MWGYAAYLHPDRDNEQLEMARRWLEKALTLDEGFLMARLYAGHAHQDRGDHYRALHHYYRVDQKRLKLDWPIWRFVKLQEQIGYCNYQLGKRDSGEAWFYKVIQAYQSYPSSDLAHPSEMLSCLDEDHPLIKLLRPLLGKV